MSDDPAASATPLGALVADGPARAPAPTTLRGRHVLLEPLDAARHAATLYALSHGPRRDELWAYMRAASFPDAAAFTRFYGEAAAKADPLLLTIAEAATGRPVGHAAYLHAETAHRVIEVGNVLFTPPLQRTPGATEAMYLMARHAFEDLGYRRYEWKCDALNAPSRRAALRFGFTFEGLFRQHMIVKGRNRDTAWFALLDHEWPRAKAAFEAWLAPGNFAPDGRQRRRLEEIRAAL